MSSISVHDHSLSSLCIDAKERALILVTEFSDGVKLEAAEAVFEGLEGYFFDGDALETILDDIVESSPLALYDRYAERMRENHRLKGGYGAWVLTRVAAERHFASRLIRGFRVESSIGLWGAVWAKSYQTRWREGSGR